MTLKEITKSGATIFLTKLELMLVNNALNEVCNGIHIDKGEFQARLGLSHSEAEQLLAAINDIHFREETL